MNALARAIVVVLTLAMPASVLVAFSGVALAQQQDQYKQHMDYGVKLVHDKNYEAAITEFKAAYAAKPNASPLIDIAICYRELFNYPKAIVALEKALAQHADTMSASDKKAAEHDLQDLRGVLAYVTVKILPDKVASVATLIVDGEEQPPGTIAKPVPLGPGTHKLAAKADGYAQDEKPITVASGEKDRVLTLTLAPDKGFLTVDGQDPRAAIVVDNKTVGQGTWGGLLPPGIHVVQILRPAVAAHVVQIRVEAGIAQTITPTTGGEPIGTGMPNPPPAPPPPRKEEPPLPPKKGLFVMAMASLTQPFTRPTGFPQASPNTGGAGGLRVGYRVNNPAAFDLMFQYANVYTGTAISSGNGYTFGTARFGAELRLMTSGKTVRFVGALGGGFTLDSVKFDQALLTTDFQMAKGCSGCQNGSGANAFVASELGIEFDLSNVLLGAVFEGQYQSSRGITPDNQMAGAPQLSGGIFSGDGIPWLGGGVRIGYAFW